MLLDATPPLSLVGLWRRSEPLAEPRDEAKRSVWRLLSGVAGVPGGAALGLGLGAGGGVAQPQAQAQAHALGPVTTFVSHAWTERFPELVETLRSHTLTTEAAAEVFSPLTAGFGAYFRRTGSLAEPPLVVEREKRYWIDVFSKDQVAASPEMLGYEGEELARMKERYSRFTEDEFQANLSACHSTEAIANGLAGGAPPPMLGRVWCLYELFNSLLIDCPLALLQAASGTDARGTRAHHGHAAEALREAPLRRAAALVEGPVHHARLLRVRGLAGDDHAAEGTAEH
jgi:hypothetical protein